MIQEKGKAEGSSEAQRAGPLQAITFASPFLRASRTCLRLRLGCLTCIVFDMSYGDTCWHRRFR